MAVTLARVGNTQNLLRYLVTQDGGGGTTAQKTQAELITDCAAGPLREAIRNANWTNLNTGMTIARNDSGGGLWINMVARTGVPTPAVIFVAAPNIMQITMAAGAATVILEIHLRHSINN